MIALPFVALKLFLKSPRLLALGFFPGFFTLLASSVAVYFLWTVYLISYAAWISYPVAVLTFLLCWLAFGKVSILPVEDFLIDECQRQRFGSVILPGRPWSFLRTLLEILFGLTLAFFGFFVFLLGLVPVFSILALVCASWLTAYSFLTPVYQRKSPKIGGRLALFFQDAAANFFLGLLLNFLLFVPALNVLLLGYAQILATLVALRKEPNVEA